MSSNTKLPWLEYASEAAGLAFFMVNAAIMTTLLEYPHSPVHRAISSAFLRRIPLGIVMGLVIVAIIYSPPGKRSGAHINPAVTWTFYRLGKISFRDAVAYTIAQFLGAIAAAETMKLLLGAPFASDSVKYATTRPEYGVFWAFVAELAITFVMMLVMLFFMSKKKLEKYVGWIAGALIMLYLFFETPLSGMSLNPARTFGSAFAGNIWDGIWLYFVAPPMGALLAAETFLAIGDNDTVCAKLCHAGHADCIFCNYRNERIPHFPPGEKAT